MPWCEDCAKYFAPSAMGEGGECPSCQRVLDAPKPRVTAKNLDLKKLARGDEPGEGDVDGESADDAGAPWHFKLLMVLLALYFVYRIYDLFR